MLLFFSYRFIVGKCARSIPKRWKRFVFILSISSWINLKHIAVSKTPNNKYAAQRSERPLRWLIVVSPGTRSPKPIVVNVINEK